jgi:2-oxoglutarate ferredoxin oxidoreductase subunit alpha
VNELDADPARLIRVLHFDGTPITARFIVQSIRAHVQQQTQASGSTDTKEPA